MSGPKRADVEAALDMVSRSVRGCAERMAKAQDAAVAALLREADDLLKAADRGVEDARAAARGIAEDLRRVAPDGVRAADAAGNEAAQAVDAARRSIAAARASMERARAEEVEARRLLDQAERDHQRVLEALRNAGAHYLHDQMQQAQAAKKLVEQAKARLAAAEKARAEAERQARTGLQGATQARAGAEGAKERARSAKAEAEVRKRAEDEARRIAEQGRREAMLAVERARGALGRAGGLQHAKFRPGEFDRLRQALAAAEARIGQGDSGGATKAAQRVLADAEALAQAVEDATREHERKLAEARSQVAGLRAAIEGTDEALVRAWAADGDAVGKARQALEAANRAVADERFDAAGKLASEAREAVTAALRGAAESKAASERREQIGDAVMDALEGLGFDVSFEPGNRTDPLRISGQSADERGRGDFDIEIPLSGDVGFHVDTPDASCAAAVGELQKRLADRGIFWQTTDWGHATGAGEGRTVVKQQQKVAEKVKGKL